MSKQPLNFWLFSTILVFGSFLLAYGSQLNCNEENSDVECLLFKQYLQMNNELACQLCAVAIESGKYPEKANLFCNDESSLVRGCGLISFTYLLTAQRFAQAFDLQYEIFYRDPFGHNERVEAVLKKQNVRPVLISWLQKNIENNSNEVYLERAIVNFYIDDISESENHLEKYLELSNGILDKRTIKLKCRIFEKQGQFNQAFNILSKYIEEAEKDQRNYNNLEPYLYHLKGNLLMHHLKFKQAIGQFKKASGMFKSYYQEVAFLRGFKFSLYNVGLCYQKMSNHQEAINTYNQLIKFGVKNAQVLNALGNSYIELSLKADSQKPDEQKLRRGIFYLTRAIEDNPEYYLAHYNLGYALLKSNKLAEAIQKFKESLKIKKTSQAQYGLLTAFLISGKLQQAQNLITKDMNVNDQSIDDLLSVYYQNGNPKQNSKFYNKVLKQYQETIKSANGHYWKAMIQFDRQNYGLAIDHFLQAYDRGYNEPHLLFNLGYCYQLVQDYKSAFQYYEKAYKKDPRPQTKQKVQQCKNMISKHKENHQL